MSDALVSPRNAIKGNAFAQCLRDACAGPFPSHPIGKIKYKRILLPHMIGGEMYVALVGVIGQALRIRGAEAVALTCDQFLPACTMRKVDHYESACTRWCHKNAQSFAEALQLPYRWYSAFITAEDKSKCDRLADAMSPDELIDFEHKGVQLGQHVALSIGSYFKIGKLDLSDPAQLAHARAFARSAMYLNIVGHNAIDEMRIDKVLMEDGKKVDWGVIRSVAAKKGVPVDCIRSAFRGYSIRFEYDRPPALMMLMPEWKTWQHIPLTSSQEHILDEYLACREKTPFESRSACWQAHIADKNRVCRKIGLGDHITGKVFAMFPNVSFDAGLTHTVTAFENANRWVTETIRFLQDRPEHHLIVKVHPAEYHRNAQDPLIPLIQKLFTELPANVHLIPPNTDITAQAAAKLADWVLCYTSTIGVEAAALGKPVMIVGGGWNSGRGFTQDVTSPQQYFELLESICAQTMQYEHPLELARRYAYALFFRSNILINHFEVLDVGVTALKIKSLNDLMPGRDPSMDVICRGILNDEIIESPGC